MTEKLKILLQEAIEERDRLNQTVYANNDWNSASNSKVNRLKIAIKAVEAGAKQVDPFYCHGVMVNNWLVISVNANKWSFKSKTWYPYGRLEDLLKKHVTDKK